MKKVSLIYGYSPRNAGDFAITIGAIDVLRSCGAKIRLFSRYNRSNKDFSDAENLLKKLYGDELEIMESPFNLDRKDGLYKTIKSYIDGALSVSGLKRNSKFRKSLLDCDLLIFNGGNLFRCSSIIDYTRLKALMYPLELAINEKPIIIFPQSAARINTMGKRVLLPVLRKAEKVYIREKESFEYLKGITSNTNFFQTIDLAFFIDKSRVKEIEQFKGSIAITLRGHTVGDITGLDERKLSHICKELKKAVEFLGKEKFIIVVQSEKDIPLSERLSKMLNIETFETHDPIELLSIYKSAKMLIGMRLHSIILALSIGTPCYGIFYKEWGLKNPGMMKYFDMPYHFLDDFSPLNERDLADIKGLADNKDVYSKKILAIVDSEKCKFVDSLTEIFKKESLLYK